MLDRRFPDWIHLVFNFVPGEGLSEGDMSQQDQTNGCIDGFSRKVMWLRSGSTNNDPGIIAQHYLQCVSEFGLLPARLRTDCGTENGTMAAINCTLRSQHTDDFAGALSQMYGTSTQGRRKQRGQGAIGPPTLQPCPTFSLQRMPRNTVHIPFQ
ncbi:hypothetical protein NQZ68_042283 [Dissostichus eleginoides]|nr:hypothetical protein NQZ68_042283 [Dissostichus eleginoides]